MNWSLDIDGEAKGCNGLFAARRAEVYRLDDLPSRPVWLEVYCGRSGGLPPLWLQLEPADAGLLGDALLRAAGAEPR